MESEWPNVADNDDVDDDDLVFRGVLSSSSEHSGKMGKKRQYRHRHPVNERSGIAIWVSECAIQVCCCSHTLHQCTFKRTSHPATEDEQTNERKQQISGTRSRTVAREEIHVQDLRLK